MDFKNGVSRPSSEVLDWDSPSAKTGTVKRRPVSHGEFSSTWEESKDQIATCGTPQSTQLQNEKKFNKSNIPCIQTREKVTKSKDANFNFHEHSLRKENQGLNVNMGNIESNKTNQKSKNVQLKYPTGNPLKYYRNENKTKPEIPINNDLKRKDSDFQIFDRGKARNLNKNSLKEYTLSKKIGNSCHEETRINIRNAKVKEPINIGRDVTRTKSRECDIKLNKPLMYGTQNTRMLNRRTLEWVKLDSEQKFNKKQNVMEREIIYNADREVDIETSGFRKAPVNPCNTSMRVSSVKICDSLVSTLTFKSILLFVSLLRFSLRLWSYVYNL